MQQTNRDIEDEAVKAAYINPIMRSENNKGKPEVIYHWVEVTKEFEDSCSALTMGELVHDNMFGLFEAMSAIEIMDPKMDAGMVCHRGRKVLQFQEAVKIGTLKIKELTPSETLGIIDELLACFVTWLDGHSLVQTVFTCLYTHECSAIDDPVLKAFCIAILKMIDFIRTIIGKAKVFEEEDFQTMSYGFKLACDITEMRASGMLREAEEELSRRIKTLSSEHTDEDDQVEELKAIKMRMKFWRAFYCALLSFEKIESLEIPKVKEWLENAQRALSEVKETMKLGLQRKEFAEKSTDPVMMGFDPLVNQRLLPPSFPRQTAVIERQKAMTYIGDLLDNLHRICSVTEFTNFHSILEFVCGYSRNEPCVLSRSILQLLIWNNGRIFGKIQLTEMLKDTIKLFNSTPVLAEMSPLSTHMEAKELANNFIARASRVMTSLLQAYGHNRARQRERMGDLLEEMGNLQEEADRTDNDLNKILQSIDPKRQHLACFGSWVLYHSLTIMIQYILLGFELELFNPHEFHYVYWYLDFLSGWGINCLSRAERLLNMQEQYVEKRTGKKEKKKKRELVAACQESIKEHQRLKGLYIGMKCLCLGFVKAYEGFDKERKIKKPKSELDNEQFRYEHRFFPFTFVDTPQPILYGQYKEATDPRHSAEYASTYLFLESMKHFERAMGILDSEGANLLKIAKTNFVVMKLAASGHKKDSKNAADWDFSSHPSYPIIKLS